MGQRECKKGVPDMGGCLVTGGEPSPAVPLQQYLMAGEQIGSIVRKEMYVERECQRGASYIGGLSCDRWGAQHHFSQQFLPELQGVECLDMGTSRFV